MNVNINKKSQYFLAKDLLNSFLNKNAEVKDVLMLIYWRNIFY